MSCNYVKSITRGIRHHELDLLSLKLEQCLQSHSLIQLLQQDGFIAVDEYNFIEIVRDLDYHILRCLLLVIDSE